MYQNNNEEKSSSFNTEVTAGTIFNSDLNPRRTHSPVMIWLSVAFTALILFLSSLPTFYDIILSVKEYTPIKGLANSPNIGFENYTKFFESFYFIPLLSNTIVQGLLFALFIFILSTLVGTIVISLPSKSIVRNTIVTVAIIIIFLPDIVYSHWFINLPLSIKPFLNPQIAVWFIPLMRAIKYVGIPVLITSVLSEKNENSSGLLPVKAGACFALFSLMFIAANDFNITFLVYNPMIYSVIDSFNTFVYRTGLLNMEISYASTIMVLRNLLCLISVAIFFIPFSILAKSLFNKSMYIESDSDSGKNKKLISTIIAIGVVIVAGILPLVVKGVNIFDVKAIVMLFNNPFVIPPILKYLILTSIAALVNVFLAIIIAYPFVSGDRIVKKVSYILILLLSIIGSISVSVGGYILFRSLGIVNTVFSVIFGLISPTACVWALIAIIRLHNVKDWGGYIKTISRPAIMLVFVQIVYGLNNYVPSLIGIKDRNMFSPMLFYREIAFMSNAPIQSLPKNAPMNVPVMVFWYGVLLSAIPIIILSVLRIRSSNTSLLSILGLAQRK